MCACRRGHLEDVKKLIGEEQVVDNIGMDNEGTSRTPLEMAVLKGTKRLSDI